MPIGTWIAAPIYILVFGVALVELVRWTRRRGKQYPPGPSGLPLFGNLFQVPSAGPWNYYEELGKTYGPIMRLSMAGDEMLVLSDPEDCENLLAKRSKKFSSRKPLVYAGKYLSNNKRLLLLGYGEELKRQRAAFAEMMNPRAVASYEVLHEQETSMLLRAMLIAPDTYKINMQRFAASLVFTLTYGKKLNDDSNLLAVVNIIDNLLPDCAPGAHLVDSFPILDWLPDAFSPWRREARKKHEYEKQLYMKLTAEVKAEMEAGTAHPCFSVNLWEQHAKGKFDRETLAYVAGSAFEAGSSTLSGTLLWFVAAMVIHPEVQAKAQAELDGLLGETGDMPSLTNMLDLPYCTALVKEVLRWMPVAPGAFPHYSDEDDEYKGFHIPKNTLVIPHVWAMHRDPERYSNPLAFDPSRFVGEKLEGAATLTAGHYGFGFGRRICPGRYLGSKSLFIAVVRMLWAFNIEPALDADGKPIPVDPYRATFNVTSEPLDFPVRISPRSAHHAAQIEKEWARVQG